MTEWVPGDPIYPPEVRWVCPECAASWNVDVRYCPLCGHILCAVREIIMILVCYCGHEFADHAVGGPCNGMVFFRNLGEFDIEAPCSCEQFKLWYAERE